MASKPQYIYKIVPASATPPSPLPAALPVSDLDKDSGYMHMSTASQVIGTLRTFFNDHNHVYVLRVPYERVAEHVKWETPVAEDVGTRPGEGEFPHIYNDFKLGKDEVDVVGKWHRGEGWDKGGGDLEGWNKADML